MDILTTLEEARRATNVLEHPFYRRWSAGEMSGGELRCYAGEYRHAVLALARASARAADGAGPAHRAELRRSIYIRLSRSSSDTFSVQPRMGNGSKLKTRQNPFPMKQRIGFMD